MNRQVREKLRDLVDADRALLRNAGRVRTLLGDAVPGASREIAALSAAVEENVPPSISRSTGSLSVQGSLDRLARSLAENRALSVEAATWAVGSWAWILHKGPVPDDATPGDGREPAAPMRAEPRRILRQILTQYGPEVRQDPALVRALLSDLAPGHRREQAALVAAAEEGVPAQLENDPGDAGGTPLTDRLIQGQSLDAEAARWAVASWAWALGRGPEPRDLVTGTPPDDPASASPFRPSPPPARGRATPTVRQPDVIPRPAPAGLASEAPVTAARAVIPPPSYPIGLPPGESIDPAPPPPPPGRRRRRIAAIVLAALLLVGIGVGGGVGVYRHFHPDWPSAVRSTFWVPPACAADPLPPGASYRIRCTTDTYVDGKPFGYPVTVIYTGWTSVAALNDYLHASSESTGLDVKSTSTGSIYHFFYGDGDAGFDWSDDDRRLTCEAKAPTDKISLDAWWASGVVKK